MFFFFQAEDGIRDHCVTGVQTCALPICNTPSHARRNRVASPCRQAYPEPSRSEEHTSELQSHSDLVCRLLLEKKEMPDRLNPSVWLAMISLLDAVAGMNLRSTGTPYHAR